MVHTFVSSHCLLSDLVIISLLIRNFFFVFIRWFLSLVVFSFWLCRQLVLMSIRDILIEFSHFRWLGADENISRSRITIVCVLFLLDIGSSTGGYVIQFTGNSITMEVSANGSATKIGTRLIVWWGGYSRLIGFAFRCVEMEIYVRVSNS